MGVRAAAGGTVQGSGADEAGPALFPEVRKRREEGSGVLVIDHFISTHTHTRSCKCNC